MLDSLSRPQVLLLGFVLGAFVALGTAATANSIGNSRGAPGDPVLGGPAPSDPRGGAPGDPAIIAPVGNAAPAAPRKAHVTVEVEVPAGAEVVVNVTVRFGSAQHIPEVSHVPD